MSHKGYCVFRVKLSGTAAYDFDIGLPRCWGSSRAAKRESPETAHTASQSDTLKL